MRLPRRRFLALLPPLAGGLLAWACGGDEAPQAAATGGGATETDAAPTATAAGAQLATTPGCGDDDEPTIAQTEGPYFTPSSPERASLLEAGVTGTKLVVEGYVLTTGCEPVARALLDFWHADAAGAYDNAGYRLRGHQLTDANGRYRLETIVPGIYTGRTRHIHVKAQAQRGRLLTTQLYFPSDAARNAQDGIYDAALLMTMSESGGAMTGRFDFVLEA